MKASIRRAGFECPRCRIPVRARGVAEHVCACVSSWIDTGFPVTSEERWKTVLDQIPQNPPALPIVTRTEPSAVDKLEAEIRCLTHDWAQSDKAFAIRIGEKLEKLRKLTPRGEQSTYMHRLHISQSTASRYERIHRHRNEDYVIHASSLRAALQKIAGPKNSGD
jgi:hypothetical protein